MRAPTRTASLPPRLLPRSARRDGPRGDTDRGEPFDEAPQTVDGAVGPTDKSATP